MTWYLDSGHGWLRVKAKEIFELGIEDKLSGFSYCKNKWVYLEEDCDAIIYASAKNLNLSDFQERKIVRCNGYSKIRTYPSYSKERLVFFYNQTVDHLFEPLSKTNEE